MLALADLCTKLVQALLINPADHSLWYDLGVNAVHIGQLPLARAAFEQVLHMQRGHYDALDKLISVTYMLGEYVGM